MTTGRINQVSIVLDYCRPPFLFRPPSTLLRQIVGHQKASDSSLQKNEGVSFTNNVGSCLPLLPTSLIKRQKTPVTLQHHFRYGFHVQIPSLQDRLRQSTNLHSNTRHWSLLSMLQYQCFLSLQQSNLYLFLGRQACSVERSVEAWNQSRCMLNTCVPSNST